MMVGIYVLQVLFLVTSVNIFSMELIRMTDPFEKANELYNKSDWSNASSEFERVHEKLAEQKNNLDNYESMDIIKGHVNYADVLFAQGVGQLNKGNYDDAKSLMLKACGHWVHRLVGRQFGRMPLDNEWDGSDLKGKRLVVYSERARGAFGDTFYMTPMLRYVKEKGAHVIFVPQKPLAALYQMVGTKQASYVDEIVLRDQPLPEHDCAIYLWSILKHKLNDESVDQIYPMEAWMSGDSDTRFTRFLEQQVEKVKNMCGQDPLVVGAWYRSAGTAVAAADH